MMDIGGTLSSILAVKMELPEGCCYDFRPSKRLVLIAAHAPPGFWEHIFYLPGPSTPYLYKHFNKKFIDVIVKYSGIISMQFYAHVHSNSFRLYMNNDQPVSSSISSSSVAPNFGVTPSIKYFTMNTNTSSIEKFLIYYMNLTRANKLYEKNHTVDIKSLWKLAGDSSNSKSGFGLQNITTKSLTSLFNQLLQNTKMFKEYTFLNMAPYQTDREPLAFVQNACAIKYSRIDKFHQCVEELGNISNHNIIYEKLHINTGVTHQNSSKQSKAKPNHNIAIIIICILAVFAVFVVIPLIYISKRKSARYNSLLI
ncbi:Acid sphingomyelinase-like phosphodiesterase 3b [Nymphon striatum]|nr:Acid sphingomyelinase-like phosphodiesterase 3b [Nymphon striatum]